MTPMRSKAPCAIAKSATDKRAVKGGGSRDSIVTGNETMFGGANESSTRNVKVTNSGARAPAPILYTTPEVRLTLIYAVALANSCKYGGKPPDADTVATARPGTLTNVVTDNTPSGATRSRSAASKVNSIVTFGESGWSSRATTVMVAKPKSCA